MKSVIITGATRGIGLALARFYADKGYCLMLNGGHNEEALAAVEKELSTKTQVITCLGSVAEEKTAATIVQKTLDTTIIIFHVLLAYDHIFQADTELAF